MLRPLQYKTDAQVVAKNAELVAIDNNGLYPLVAGDFAGLGVLPAQLSIGTVIASSVASPTTTAGISTPRAYTIQVCNTGRGGVRVYYPNPTVSTTAIASVDAGTYAASC